MVGTKVYTLADKRQTTAPFAGKHIRIEWDLKGKTITLISIQETQHNMQI